MKVKDLTLGNYVHLITDDIDEYVRVNALGECMIVAQAKTGTREIVDEYDIKPITLTEEILQRNGWRKNALDGAFYHDNAFTLYGKRAPFYVLDGMRIDYVHELQNMLTINKMYDIAQKFVL